MLPLPLMPMAAGAVGGAIVGGAVGAVVGGIGGIAEATRPQFRTYVVQQNVPSYTYTSLSWSARNCRSRASPITRCQRNTAPRNIATRL